MGSTRTSDAAAAEEQAAGTKTEDADAADEETGEAGGSEVEADSDSDGTTDETGATTEDADEASETTDDADDADDADEGVDGEPGDTARRGVSSVGAGAAAVVGAGLGLASLTGTWLSDLMSSRQELIGQIHGQAATPAEQVAAIYGTPWHTTALFNGFFALAAILVAGGALVVPTLSKDGGESPTWVRAVAVGGLVLGTIGLVIAALMWFDVFTELPAVPAA